MYNSQRVLPAITGKFAFKCCDVASLSRLDPFNIIMMFDLAFEPELMLTIRELVYKSNTPLLILSLKNLIDYDFDVEELDKFQIKMSGSGECHIARIYRY